MVLMQNLTTKYSPYCIKQGYLNGISWISWTKISKEPALEDLVCILQGYVPYRESSIH